MILTLQCNITPCNTFEKTIEQLFLYLQYSIHLILYPVGT